MALVLTDEQECDLEPEFLTAAGNPGRIDGQPVWSSSNPGVATVTVDETGLKALVRSVGLGVTQVSVSVDADLGEGVRNVSQVLDVTVAPAEVVTVGIIAGTPRTKPV